MAVTRGSIAAATPDLGVVTRTVGGAVPLQDAVIPVSQPVYQAPVAAPIQQQQQIQFQPQITATGGGGGSGGAGGVATAEANLTNVINIPRNYNPLNLSTPQLNGINPNIPQLAAMSPLANGFQPAPVAQAPNLNMLDQLLAMGRGGAMPQMQQGGGRPMQMQPQVAPWQQGGNQAQGPATPLTGGIEQRKEQQIPLSAMQAIMASKANPNGGGVFSGGVAGFGSAGGAQNPPPPMFTPPDKYGRPAPQQGAPKGKMPGAKQDQRIPAPPDTGPSLAMQEPTPQERMRQMNDETMRRMADDKRVAIDPRDEEISRLKEEIDRLRGGARDQGGANIDGLQKSDLMPPTAPGRPDYDESKRRSQIGEMRNPYQFAQAQINQIRNDAERKKAQVEQMYGAPLREFDQNLRMIRQQQQALFQQMSQLPDDTAFEAYASQRAQQQVAQQNKEWNPLKQLMSGYKLAPQSFREQSAHDHYYQQMINNRDQISKRINNEMMRLNTHYEDVQRGRNEYVQRKQAEINQIDTEAQKQISAINTEIKNEGSFYNYEQGVASRDYATDRNANSRDYATGMTGYTANRATDQRERDSQRRYDIANREIGIKQQAQDLMRDRFGLDQTKADRLYEMDNKRFEAAQRRDYVTAQKIENDMINEGQKILMEKQKTMMNMAKAVKDMGYTDEKIKYMEALREQVGVNEIDRRLIPYFRASDELRRWVSMFGQNADRTANRVNQTARTVNQGAQTQQQGFDRFLQLFESMRQPRGVQFSDEERRYLRELENRMPL